MANMSMQYARSTLPLQTCSLARVQKKNSWECGKQKIPDFRSQKLKTGCHGSRRRLRDVIPATVSSGV